jgi:hypothetical protein
MMIYWPRSFILVIIIVSVVFGLVILGCGNSSDELIEKSSLATQSEVENEVVTVPRREAGQLPQRPDGAQRFPNGERPNIFGGIVE